MKNALYFRITGADPDSADLAKSEPRNAVIHILSLALTKLSDGLVNPKLVLAWLMNASGAPGVVIGALVPVREAGSLLPQLVIAPLVQRAKLRKRVWAFGSFVQGLAALGIAAAFLFLDGPTAWSSALACLAVLSAARAVCSVSHKDALARTVGKTRRGAIMGLGASIASFAVLAFGAGLAAGVIPMTVPAVSIAVILGGLLWIAAAALFVSLDETPEPDGKDGKASNDLFAPLFEDAQLRLFIAVRAFLTATALAPPFIVMLSATSDGQTFGELGPLVLAAATASILSAYFWGRLSDVSSRRALTTAGILGAVALGPVAVLATLRGDIGGVAAAALAIFGAQVAHEGVRSARKIHLTDMADDTTRARYTALSNALIGLVLIAGGAFGLLADLAGPAAVLAVFAGMCVTAALLAVGLDEVQRKG